MQIEFPVHYLLTLLLMAARISAAFVTMPFFGGRQVPALLRLALGMLVSAALLPAGAALSVPPPEGLAYVALLLREVLLGLVIGFLVNLAAQAVQLAAGLLDVQIGFSFVSTIDPMVGDQSALLERFYMALAVLVFLASDAHHLFLQALSRLFEVVPVGTFEVTGMTAGRVIRLSSALFSAALGLALPIVGPLLVVDLAMAVMARAMPQLNVLAVNLPAKMLVGMLLLALAMSVVVGRVTALMRGAPGTAVWGLGG
jgi:flagellar biosynthetic protein FliR